MHCRWSFPETARLMSAWLAEHMAERRRVSFVEPVRPYAVWCRDRLQRRLAELEASGRAEVERALGSSEAVERLAAPSPRPARNPLGSLPLIAPPRSHGIDGWWRE